MHNSAKQFNLVSNFEIIRLFQTKSKVCFCHSYWPTNSSYLQITNRFYLHCSSLWNHLSLELHLPSSPEPTLSLKQAVFFIHCKWHQSGLILTWLISYHFLASLWKYLNLAIMLSKFCVCSYVCMYVKK